MNIIRFADLCAQGKAQGQRVFIRADLNVPFDDHGHISEDTRIRASVPCIQMALAAGAAVMVTSHLGRPTEGDFKPEDSLAPVAKRLGELLGCEVPLVANWVNSDDSAQALQTAMAEVGCQPHQIRKIICTGIIMRRINADDYNKYCLYRQIDNRLEKILIAVATIERYRETS